MSGSNGSTTLTAEQTAWFKEKLGIPYRVVQTNASVPNRRTRRALKKQRRR